MSNTSENGRNIHREWVGAEELLIKFYRSRIIVRSDTYVGYYSKVVDGKRVVSSARKGAPLTDTVLHNHIFAYPDCIMGAYTTCPKTNTTLRLHIDVDAHPPKLDENGQPKKKPVDPADNFKFAGVVFRRLRADGMNPILMDSNGKGGVWIDVYFSEPVDAGRVREYGLLITRDYEKFNVDDPEIFPKQATVKEDGYGNMVRLPGRHHKRRHHTRVLGYRYGKLWFACCRHDIPKPGVKIDTRHDIHDFQLLFWRDDELRYSKIKDGSCGPSSSGAGMADSATNNHRTTSLL
jgi:hypothetical protein